jgi:hypothetical protein
MRHTGRPRGILEADGLSSEVLPSHLSGPEMLPTRALRFPLRPCPAFSITWGAMRVARCARELPDEALCQVALGKLEDEVPGMPDQAPPGLEEPLLEARQRPALDGEGQSQPEQQIAEIVGDDREEQSHLVGPEAIAGEPGPMRGFFSLLDPLLPCAALVVEVHDGPVRPGQRGDDEGDPGEQLAEVMLDLGDDPSRTVPGGRLIVEAPIADQGGVPGSATGPREQILDGPLQHLVGREANGIRHPALLQRLVQSREGKRRIRPNDDGLLPSLVARNDGEENLLPLVRTVDVARPERGGEAVAGLIEDEERMVADRLEVPVVGRLLLRAVHWTLRAVDIERHAAAR